jgi:hypothetical protein
LPDYKRLTALRLNQPVSNIPALLDILRACPALEELTISPGGAGYYVLYKGLRADGRLKTVNGQALAEWDPFSELETAQDQYNFTVGELDEVAYALEEELGAFERSEEAPPGSDGPILIADKKQDDPLTFHTPYREGFAVRYEDCAALAVVLKEYEYAGRYADGTGGYRGTFSVQIIDLQTQTRYAPIEWQTVEPPAEKMGDGDVYPGYRLDGGETEETAETGPALLDLLADMGYWGVNG